MNIILGIVFIHYKFGLLQNIFYSGSHYTGILGIGIGTGIGAYEYYDIVFYFNKLF